MRYRNVPGYLLCFPSFRDSEIGTSGFSPDGEAKTCISISRFDAFLAVNPALNESPSLTRAGRPESSIKSCVVRMDVCPHPE